MAATDRATREQEIRAEMRKRILRAADRKEDWDAFAFEEPLDPNYHRAQIRYIGAGGSGKYADDRVHPAGSFTLSIMKLPPDAGGPPHTHEVEEVFFCLRGEVVVFWWEDGIQVEETLQPWDMIYCPPGVHRGFRNDTAADAYFQIMLGLSRPAMPRYADPRIDQLKAEREAALAAEHGTAAPTS